MRNWAEMALEDLNPSALFIDGHDHAIIGVTDGRVVYSERMIIRVIISEGCTEEEAWDHYGFNILGSIQDGENWPLIVKQPELMEGGSSWPTPFVER